MRPRAAAYVPERGDLMWLTFNPQAGHEQAGRRPALVLSPAPYNKRTSLALICPVTSRIKGYPFEVSLPPSLGVAGVVLADQLRSLDWRARSAQFIARCPKSVLGDLTMLIKPLLGL